MAAIKARGLTHTDLAMMLIPPKPHLQGDDLKRAVSAARVKVSRFFDENAAKRIRTIEMIRAWTDALDLTPFEYRAASREQAAALRLAMADPAQIQRVICLAATVPVQLEYLNVYPRLTSVVRALGSVALHFELEATA